MTTITIDIPDNHTTEVMAQLKKLGVKVRESKLDKLTKEDYQKHFSNQAKTRVLNEDIDATQYLLKSSNNAAGLLKSIEVL